MVGEPTFPILCRTMMDRSRDLVVVLTTVPDRDAGVRIARTLVEERLIACANLAPGLTSIYRWEGELRTEDELLLLMKTRRAHLSRLTERLPQLHPYDIPELLALPVESGLPVYCDWVLDETVEAGA
jgi:periplasmic divalent cation tolerance protein